MIIGRKISQPESRLVDWRKIGIYDNTQKNVSNSGADNHNHHWLVRDGDTYLLIGTYKGKES